MKKPKVIQFPVNNICNSRCQMCDIWQQQKEHEITPLELRKVLKDPLFTEVKSVGLNGGEPTLRSDLADLARELCLGLPKLRAISLITNGLKPNLVIPRVTELYDVTKEAGVKLDIMLSLDGVGDVHDRVRGRLGNFSAVEECLHYFRANNIGDSHRLGCTLIDENIEDAERLMLWSERQGVYCRFRVGIPHKRLYTQHKNEPFSLTAKKKFHLCNFLDTLSSRYERTNPKRRLFLRNLRNQIAYDLPRTNGCTWQDRGVTLLSGGDLAFCAPESPVLGNLLKGSDLAALLYFNAEHIRNDIIRGKCDKCLHDYEGKFTRLKHRLSIRFQQLSARFKIPPKLINALALLFRLFKYSFKLFFHTCNPAYSNSHSSKCQVLIVGWYGTETLGDKAILFSIIQQLIDTGLPASQITIASIEPYVTRYTLKEFSPASTCSVISLSQAESKAKAGQFSQVIFGGGPIMSSVDYLCGISSIFRSVHKYGGQSIVWGCGIGPIRNKKRDFLNKIAISHILNVADVCVFRDHESLELAKEFVGPEIESRSNVALDPAFHWVESHSPQKRVSSRVGFAIRSIPISEYYFNSTPDSTLDLQAFDSAIASLLHHHVDNGSVYLQCMHRLSCGGDDRLYYHELLGDDIVKYDVSLEHRNPSQDVSSLACLDRIYAMRFHSVVFAVALGVPVIPIDYTNGGKIKSFCKLLRISSWSPEQLVDQVINKKTLPTPQRVDPKLLTNLISASLATYKSLALRVTSFADS